MEQEDSNVEAKVSRLSWLIGKRNKNKDTKLNEELIMKTYTGTTLGTRRHTLRGDQGSGNTAGTNQT